MTLYKIGWHVARERKVSIAIIGKTKQFTDSITRSSKVLNKFGNIAAGIGKATAAGLGVATVAAATAGREIVNLASDANEARSAFETTFGKAVPELSGFVDDFANKAGLAAFELEGLLTQSGAVLQGIEFTAEGSADLSQKLATLAGDVASFSNVQGGAQPVLEAFTKALLGERESLKTFGIAILEADVQQQAFIMTGKTSAKELTKQEKALATYELLLQKTKVQQGDLNRTQESFANKSREATAKLKELKVQMGNELLPIAEAMLPVLMEFVAALSPAIVDAIKAAAPFIQAIGDLIAAIAPPILMIVTMLLNLLAPAFQKFTQIVDKFIKPFLTNLPKNFENMINRIINSLNSFIDTINGFVDRVQGVLGRIGINIDLPKLSKFRNISLGFAEKEVKRLTPTEPVVDPATVTAQLTSQQQQAQAAALNAVSQGGVNINFNGNVSNQADVGRLTVEALKKFEQSGGRLSRVITIQ